MPLEIADVLPDDLLDRIRGRAGKVDAESGFPSDDLAELAEAGYLRLLVPTELGGLGASLEEACRAQRRLATAAPATALAVNMHHIWAGMGRVLRERGDRSLDWVLREIAAGEVYALGISEPGNDAVLFDSTVRAERDADGGVRFTGAKVFTSLSPAWTRLGVFGKEEPGEGAPAGAEPRLVHGILHRGDPGIDIRDDWVVLGMRGTQSRTTVLDGARVPAERLVASLPVGPNAEPFTFAVFANFLLLISSVYLGVAERALEIAIEGVRERTSRTAGGRALADDPQVRDQIAVAGMRELAARTLIEATARDVDELAQHGAGWFPRLTNAKSHAMRAARRTVEESLELVGGRGFRADAELARLYRDAAASLFHPSSERGIRQTFANWMIGPVSEGQAPEQAAREDDVER